MHAIARKYRTNSFAVVMVDLTQLLVGQEHVGICEGLYVSINRLFFVKTQLAVC